MWGYCSFFKTITIFLNIQLTRWNKYWLLLDFIGALPCHFSWQLHVIASQITGHLIFFKQTNNKDIKAWWIPCTKGQWCRKYFHVMSSCAEWFIYLFSQYVGCCHQSLLLTRINTLRPRQNGRHFPDAIFKRIFFNENAWISIKFSLKFVPKVPINNIPALVQIMAWRRSGDKLLSETMMDSFLMHICVTRPQWVNKSMLSSGHKREIIFHTFIWDVITHPCPN